MTNYKNILIILAAVTLVYTYDQSNLENQSANEQKLRKWRPSSKWFADIFNERMANERQMPNDAPMESTNDQPPFMYGEVNIDEYEAEMYPHLYGLPTGRDGKYPRHIHASKLVYQSLCPTIKRPVLLNEDPQFEYRPMAYEEIICAHPMQSNIRNKVCSDVGLSCIQLNRTIFITRRSLDSSCWETETRVIPSGCECMWPKHRFGDISERHY